MIAPLAPPEADGFVLGCLVPDEGSREGCGGITSTANIGSNWHTDTSHIYVSQKETSLKMYYLKGSSNHTCKTM